MKTKNWGIEVILMGYPIEIRKSVIKKVLLGKKPHCEIAKEAGIGLSTLRNWLKDNKKKGTIKLNLKEKRPHDWVGADRVEALIETGGMSDIDRTAWCRKKGIYTHHLDRWKKDAIDSTPRESGKGDSIETRRLKKQITGLKRELSRKEKALAETAALLVLKKKADFIWGEPEDD